MPQQAANQTWLLCTRRYSLAVGEGQRTSTATQAEEKVRFFSLPNRCSGSRSGTNSAEQVCVMGGGGPDTEVSFSNEKDEKHQLVLPWEGLKSVFFNDHLTLLGVMQHLTKVTLMKWSHRSESGPRSVGSWFPWREARPAQARMDASGIESTPREPLIILKHLHNYKL